MTPDAQQDAGDGTTRPGLEEELRRERRWSGALAAAMHDGLVVFRGGRATQVNPRFCAMTGWDADALVGRPANGSPFWPPEDAADLASFIADARASGSVERRATLVRADGTRFPAQVAARCLRDEAEHPGGMLVTVKDVTAVESAAERSRLGLELGAVATTARRLRGLFEAARAVADPAGLDALLREIVHTVSEDLGWVVVINLYRPAWDDFVVATGHGIPPEGWAVLEGATYEWSAWTPLLDEGYERRGAYFIPEGAEPEAADHVTWAPSITVIDAPDAWRRDDQLLIPFRHSQGHFLGIMALDAPASGRRPSDAEIDVLVAIAGLAGLAVQHAQTSIEAARHAAALDSLLAVSCQVAATRSITPLLEVVVAAIADALGFSRVVVEVADDDGALSPRAGWDAAREDPASLPAWAPVRPEELDGVLAPVFAVEGCFLLSPDEALERMPAARRDLLASRSNGRGWRAWEDHVALVPLLDADDRVVGVVWVDDPQDRLLPSSARMQALHAFANQASAAMVAARSFERLALVSDGDPLTQLGNRRAFKRELEREAARAARTGASSVLVLADVQGCEALDPDAAPAFREELRDVVAAFEGELRRHDRIFRVDGSLFAVMLTGGETPPETAAVTLRVAARLEGMGRGRGMRVAFGTAALGRDSGDAQAVVRQAGARLVAATRLRSGAAPS